MTVIAAKGLGHMYACIHPPKLPSHPDLHSDLLNYFSLDFRHCELYVLGAGFKFPLNIFRFGYDKVKLLEISLIFLKLLLLKFVRVGLNNTEGRGVRWYHYRCSTFLKTAGYLAC